MVKDDNDMEDGNIKDVDIMLQTDYEGNAKFVTPKINGFLLVVIAKVKKDKEIFMIQYDLRISLDGYDDILIFNEKNINKNEIFVPIKVDYYNVNTELWNGQADFWALNDKLVIQLSGPKDFLLYLKLRYKKW